MLARFACGHKPGVIASLGSLRLVVLMCDHLHEYVLKFFVLLLYVVYYM